MWGETQGTDGSTWCVIVCMRAVHLGHGRSKGYVEGVIGMLSTLGVHWKVMVCVSVLTWCVSAYSHGVCQHTRMLCTVECIMYIGGELG